MKSRQRIQSPADRAGGTRQPAVSGAVERRRSRRFGSSGLVLYTAHQRARQCRLLDVSTNGLRVAADHAPLPPGSRLGLILVGGDVVTRAESRVVWSTFGQFGVALVEPLSPRVVGQLNCA